MYPNIGGPSELWTLEPKFLSKITEYPPKTDLWLSSVFVWGRERKHTEIFPFLLFWILTSVWFVKKKWRERKMGRETLLQKKKKKLLQNLCDFESKINEQFRIDYVRIPK